MVDATNTAWKTLAALGLPQGASRTRTRPQPDSAVDALRQLEPYFDKMDSTQTELLLAWLQAWKRHWPTQFNHILGTAGSIYIDHLSRRPYDLNRYIKFRRIAIENIAAWSTRY